MPSRPFLPLGQRPRTPLLVILLLALVPPAMLLSWSPGQLTVLTALAALLALFIGALLPTLAVFAALGYPRQRQVLYGISVRFHGRRYRRGIRDTEAAGRLKWIVTACRSSAGDRRPPRLVQYRDEFRAIAVCGPIAGLVECLKSEDRELQRLALWLLGRCGRNRGADAVAACRRHENVTIRREAARALQRLRVLPALQAMALHDADPRVRRLATCSPPADFAERLSRFSRAAGQVPEGATEKSRMAMFLRLPVGPGKPAKTREFIQRILEHIRYLVHGVRKNGPSENSA